VYLPDFKIMIIVGEFSDVRMKLVWRAVRWGVNRTLRLHTQLFYCNITKDTYACFHKLRRNSLSHANQKLIYSVAFHGKKY